MNILIDNLPEQINGIPIRTDFRNMIQFELLMEDGEIPASDKLLPALNLLYREPVPNLRKAWDGLSWFYRCGEEETPGQAKSGETAKKLYDFEQDAFYLYSAFQQVYQIDLQKEPLHWWAFMSLLSSLPESCLMGEIMRYRGMDTSKLKGPEKKRIQQLQRIFAIRKNNHTRMNLEERNAAMLAHVRQRQRQAQEWLKTQQEAKEGGIYGG